MSGIVLCITRWAARCAAILVAGAFLLLVASEILKPHSGPPTRSREWARIALLTTTVVGTLLAWKGELPGALPSLVAVAAFVLCHAHAPLRNHRLCWHSWTSLLRRLAGAAFSADCGEPLT